MTITFFKEKNFRETKIGKMPEDWRVVSLESVAEINRESVDPAKEFPDNEFSYVDIESIEGGSGIIDKAKQILGKDAPSRARRIIHKNDVIMSTVRPYLKAFAIVPDSYNGQVCSTGFAVLTSKNEILPRFLLYNLFSDSVIGQCNSMMVGGQYPALNSSMVSKILVPLPSILEQQKISEILSNIDETIQKTNEVTAKTERLKKGLMQELLMKGIGHKEFKDSEIGRIPKEWMAVMLEDVLVFCQYGLSVPMSEKGKYPIVRMDELVDGRVSSEITKFVDLDKETFEGFKLEKGDVLFNRTNSYELVGRTGVFLLDGDYVFASYLIRLKPRLEMLDPLFLTFYLTFSNNRLKQMATKAVHQANINATNLRRFRVPLPPLKEQQTITDMLSTVDKKLQIEKEEKARLERIRQGLMGCLLTGKIRVR